MNLSKPNPKAAVVKCYFTLSLPPCRLNFHDILGLETGGLKLQCLMAGEVRLCFSPCAVSLKHRERHSLLCFEQCIRQLMTKLLHFSWTDKLKLHLKGLKCFQEHFGNSDKNNIYLCPESLILPGCI